MTIIPGLATGFWQTLIKDKMLTTVLSEPFRRAFLRWL